MRKLKLPQTTLTCRLCNGESQAPWPPRPGGGPTHHTCCYGEERQILEKKYIAEKWFEENKTDVLSNLLKNAIKLLIKSQPPSVPVSWDDSGMGIKEDPNWIYQKEVLIKQCERILYTEEL